MSQFIGGALPTGILAKDDKQATRIREQFAMAAAYAPSNYAFHESPYTTQYWPGNRNGFIGDGGLDVGLSVTTGYWEQPDCVMGGGCASRYAVIGVTRDKYGSILGGCTVDLLLTAANGNYPADTLVYTTTSDPTTGAFTLLTSFYPDGHKINVYKSGTPDVFATSVNTIIAG